MKKYNRLINSGNSNSIKRCIVQSPSVPCSSKMGVTLTHTRLPLSALIFTLRPVRDLSVCVYNLLQPHKSDPKERPKRTPLRFDSLSPALPPPRRSMRVHVCDGTEGDTISDRQRGGALVRPSVLSPARLPFPLLPPPLQRSVAAPKAVDYGGGPLRRVRPFGVRSCYDRRLI